MKTTLIKNITFLLSFTACFVWASEDDLVRMLERRIMQRNEEAWLARNPSEFKSGPIKVTQAIDPLFFDALQKAGTSCELITNIPGLDLGRDWRKEISVITAFGAWGGRLLYNSSNSLEWTLYSDQF